MDSLPSAELRRFSRDEVLRMTELGLFADDEHLELLHGRLIVVPPQGPPHTFSSSVIGDRLRAAYSGIAVIREDKPLDCGPEDLPEPDLVAARGAHIDYVARHPRGDEALLVVEVSHSTQRKDREKASIYARAGVPTYWLLDVERRRLEVYERPLSDGYALTRIVGESESVDVPATTVSVVVRELLPPQ